MWCRVWMPRARSVQRDGEEQAAAVFAGIRRLSAIADSASEPEEIVRALASELLRSPGGDEVHVHYLQPPGRRATSWSSCTCSTARVASATAFPGPSGPPGVNWVASTGSSFLAAHSRRAHRQRAAAGPDGAGALRRCCCALADRGEAQAVVMLVRRSADALRARRRRARQCPGAADRRPRWRSCRRAPRRGRTRSPAR